MKQNRVYVMCKSCERTNCNECKIGKNCRFGKNKRAWAQAMRDRREAIDWNRYKTLLGGE